MMSDIYDSDDAMGRSPPLKPAQPKYGPHKPPPPPFVNASDEDDDKTTGKDPKGTHDRSRKPHLPETQTQTRHGDSVLMHYLGPDCPEVAVHARDFPYSDWPLKQDRLLPAWKVPSRSPGTEEGPSERDGILGGRDTGGGRGAGGDEMDVGKAQTSVPAPAPAPTVLLKSISKSDFAEDEAKLKPVVEQSAPQSHMEEKSDPQTSVSPRLKPLTPLLPPPAPPALPTDFKSELVSPRLRPRLQSITEFPPVRPAPELLKRSPELGHRVSLPSLQSLSPPSSTVGASPDSASCNPNTKTLPSIQSALGGFSPSEFPPTRLNSLPPPYPYSSCPGSATSTDSPHDRQLSRQFLPSHIPPSPFSHLSPISAKDHSNNPSPASQPSSAFWRGAPPPPPQPAAETPHHVPSPYDTSPMTAKSPLTSYPTPTEPVASTPGSSERGSLSSTAPLNGTGPTGSYKCTHPGCTAAPFQTQYLLNSHANVHSQDRPHFCPVEGCPRGLGGKGFKRKNEMMRHGLVHNSPGYVCPFCPDQQHKYPRPDNLQRHVRVHHVDKSKDDPILRQVLAQRPVGSTRGRRRRSNFA